MSAWIRQRIRDRSPHTITAPDHVHLTPASLHLAYLASSDAIADYANEAPTALRWRYASLSEAEQPRYDAAYDAVLAAMARGDECPRCLCGMAEDALRAYVRESGN